MMEMERCDSIQPESAWVIAPVDVSFEIKKGIFVCSPKDLDINRNVGGSKATL